MEYWGVDDLYLEPCCVQRYYQQRELLNWDHQLKKEEEEEIFPPGRIGKLQKILWDLFEKPHTSLGARVGLCLFITTIITFKWYHFTSAPVLLKVPRPLQFRLISSCLRDVIII